MLKSDLAKAISDKTKLSIKQSESLVDAFTNTIEQAIKDGQKVVYSNFGTFYTVHYPSKVIYHPILGLKKKMVMLPTDAIKWMPSNNVKDMVDTGLNVEGATSHGAKKKLNQIIKDEGISTKKATEVEEVAQTEDLLPEEGEEFEIPIKNFSKSINKVSLIGSGIFDSKTEPSEQKIEAEPTKDTLEGESIEVKTKPEKVSSISTVTNDSGFEFLRKDDDTPEKPKNKEPEDINDQIIAKDEPDKSPLESSSSEIETTETESEEVEPEEDFEKDSQPIFSLKKNNLAYIDLSKITVPKEVLQKVPEKIAREYKIVPVEETDKEFTIAMIDPEDVEAIELVRKIVPKQIVTKLTTETDINHVLDQYQGFESEVQTAIEEVSEDSDEVEDTLKKSKDSLIAEASDSAPAARIVSSLLKRAIRDKASDIHIEPTDTEVIVRFRLDGVLHKKVTLPKDIQMAVVSRIKILSNLKIDEQRLPQDGRFSIKVDNRRIDFRVSTMPIANGEKVVMRVLDKLVGIKTISDLGFRKRDYDAIIANTEKSHGMILVTGPTGSGKTTTLYALIDQIYSEGINIITLEDPIEYQMPGINQSQVNSEIDYTFASGLRSILRQDPDVVMIGEIRDGETAEMAVHAALTGHVVLSTLHTNDSAGAIPRLLDMDIEPFLLNSSLNMVIGQRLARKLCDSCKTETKLTPDQKALIDEEIEKMPANIKAELKKKGLKFYKNKGCKNCSDTGYKGRIGLYEVLEVTNLIKEMIGDKKPSQFIKDESIKNGMTTMVQDGIIKATEGVTTIEEVWRVTKE